MGETGRQLDIRITEHIHGYGKKKKNRSKKSVFAAHLLDTFREGSIHIFTCKTKKLDRVKIGGFTFLLF